MQFFYFTQTVSTSQTSELLHFLKNHVARSIFLLYTFGQFLAKSLKITHLNLLLITQKAFQWTWLVEPRLWSSFAIHWIILCKSIYILVRLFVKKLNLSWCLYGLSAYNVDVGVLTFFPGLKTMKRYLLIKRKTNDFDT